MIAETAYWCCVFFAIFWLIAAGLAYLIGWPLLLIVAFVLAVMFIAYAGLVDRRRSSG